jgi:hypothetical protein
MGGLPGFSMGFEGEVGDGCERRLDRDSRRSLLPRLCFQATVVRVVPGQDVRTALLTWWPR